MVNFVVWLKEAPQAVGGSAKDEFARQRPALTPIFQQNANVTIVMEGMMGVHCEAPDDSTVDSFKKTLPPQWQVDRSQYKVEH